VVAYFTVALRLILTFKHAHFQLKLKTCLKKTVFPEKPVKKPVFNLPAGFFKPGIKIWKR
jgi:hypothetical protein